MEVKIYQCQICRRKIRSVDSLIVHLKYQHGLSRGNDVYKCMNPNCLRIFQSLFVYKRHLKQCGCHNLEGSTRDSRTSPINSPLVQMNASTPQSSSDQLINDPIQSPEDRLKEATAILCAKFYSHPSLPNNVVQKIIDDITSFVDEGYFPIVEDLLQSKSLPTEQLPVEQISKKLLKLNSPFKDMSSHHLRIKYFKNSAMFIPPVSYVIGESLCKTLGSDSIPRVTSVTSKAQYLPISKTLKLMLQTPGVLKMMRDNVSKINEFGGLTKSVMQGKLWREKLSYFNSKYGPKEVYPLLIYFDDLECGCPLSSRAGSQKLGTVYYTCPALPAYLLSKLENIHVASIFKSKDRFTYGNGPVFKPIVAELQQLECEGIFINTLDEQCTVHFMVLGLVGDNLGLHSMMGFVESFSANYFCRFCKSSKAETKHMIEADLTLNRSVDDYDPSPNIETDNLIKEYCTWNDIGSFHCWRNIIGDPMHDIFEGICRYEMSEIINYFITVEILSLHTINSRLKYLDFGVDSDNAPPPIKTEHLKKGSIIFSASEMYTLVKYFTFAVGDLVPQDNEVWCFYLYLRKIVEFVMLDSFSPGSSLYLKGMITSHHCQYLKLFKGTLKPKHHFLLHYPSILEQMGPFKQFWCMRFEGKHRQLKRYASAISSRKNLPLSLATKCQLQLCFRLISTCRQSDAYFNTVSLGPFTGIVKYSSSNEDLSLRSFSWVESKGVRFKKGNIIVTGSYDDEPMFVKILHVTKNYDCISFIVQNYLNICFSIHFDSYQVTPGVSRRIYNLPNDFKCRPLNAILANNGNYYIPYSG